MEGKVAVFGNADFVMPFSALGLSTFAVDDSKERIAETAKRIIEDKYTLVVVSENIAADADEAFSATHNKPLPCIVVVPFTIESTGFATKALGDVLKAATGIDILQNN